MKMFLITTALAIASIAANADVLDADVIHGELMIDDDVNKVSIIQETNVAIIELPDFSNHVGEMIEFKQPNSEAIAIVVVTGDMKSEIFGDLISNGIVILLNPNGFHFGKDSKVSMCSLFASTTLVSNYDDLLKSINDKQPIQFDKPSTVPNTSIVNDGHIEITCTNNI